MIARIENFASLANHDPLRSWERHCAHLVDEFPIVLSVLLYGKELFPIAEYGTVVPMAKASPPTNSFKRRIDIHLALINDFAKVDNLDFGNNGYFALHHPNLGLSKIVGGCCREAGEHCDQPSRRRHERAGGAILGHPFA